MTCELDPAQLRLYLESKLPAAEAARVQAHLETCTPCQSVQLVGPELGRLLREKVPARSAPASLRRRLQQALDAEAKAPAAPVPVSLSRWRAALGSTWTPRVAMAALGLFLLWVAGSTFLRAPAMAAEVVQRHAAHAPFCGGELPPCCRDLHLPAGASLAFPSEGEAVPNLEAAGLTLVVTSRCDGGTPVNLLCYRNSAGELFSLYITDQVTEQFLLQSRSGGRHRVQSHEVVAWERHGFVHFWVGPRSRRNDTDRALALLRQE